MAHFCWLGSFYTALYHSRLPMFTRLVKFQTDAWASFSISADGSLRNLIHFVKVIPTFWKLYNVMQLSIIRSERNQSGHLNQPRTVTLVWSFFMGHESWPNFSVNWSRSYYVLLLRWIPSGLNSLISENFFILYI